MLCCTNVTKHEKSRYKNSGNEAVTDKLTFRFKMYSVLKSQNAKKKKFNNSIKRKIANVLTSKLFYLVIFYTQF